MRTLLLAALVGSTLGFMAGCQSYDFQRVDPLAVSQTKQTKSVVAKNLKPNMMLLVDKSGSMNLPTDPGNSNCPAGCGGSMLCPSNCPTRISELKSAMNGFLNQYGNVARFGLAFFPAQSDVCAGTPAGQFAEPLPDPATTDPAAGPMSTYQLKANAVNTKIQAVTPGGGTPTGESLKNVGAAGGLRDNADLRDDFIVLLTDGLPNCNPNNTTNSCQMPNNPACICTIGNASACSGQLCAKGCLDRSGVVEQVQNLRAAGIKVIVVGFGADTASGDAPATLNAMAAAGGFARTCPMGTDAECGTNNACVQSTKVCRSQFYQAANGAELGKALADISNLISGDTICKFTLDSQPSDPKLLAVTVNGVSLSQSDDTWRFEDAKVVFKGAQCTALQQATPANPVNVEIRVVETL